MFECLSHVFIAQFKLEPHDKPVATGRSRRACGGSDLNRIKTSETRKSPPHTFVLLWKKHGQRIGSDQYVSKWVFIGFSVRCPKFPAHVLLRI